MSKNKDTKTNVMRILDTYEISYDSRTYTGKKPNSGLEVAQAMGLNPESMFKTLVTETTDKRHFVFLVPVASELDLKKAAKAVGEKKISMLPAKELLPLTGYMHGGCSPIGMKKEFPTIIDETAILHETISFSAGKVGVQIKIKLNDLSKVLDYKLADIQVS